MHLSLEIRYFEAKYQYFWTNYVQIHLNFTNFFPKNFAEKVEKHEISHIFRANFVKNFSRKHEISHILTDISVKNIF